MTIINDLLGKGHSTGKVDEFGLPLADVSKKSCGANTSIEDILHPTKRNIPYTFVLSPNSHEDSNLSNAYFYDISKADTPIAAGWKRGLYGLNMNWGLCGLSILVRKPVAGMNVRVFVADTAENAEVMSVDIDGEADCGKAQVFRLPAEMILHENHHVFIEIVSMPDPFPCCPFELDIHALVADYCHEAGIWTPIPCEDTCSPCVVCVDGEGASPAEEVEGEEVEEEAP